MFTTPQSAACPNGQFDAINPSLRELSWSIGAKPYPTYSLKPSAEPAKTMSHLVAALGSQSSFRQNGGTLFRSSYGASLPSVYSGSDNMMVVPANGLRPTSGSDAATWVITNYPNCFYTGICLERMSSILFSGANTKDTNGMQLNLVLNTATAVQTQVSSFALCDAIIFFNVNERSCRILV